MSDSYSTADFMTLVAVEGLSRRLTLLAELELDKTAVSSQSAMVVGTRCGKKPRSA